MTMKPPKKSDIKKQWRKNRRDNYRMVAPEYHLIVTEGVKTEPLYFEGLKRDINCNYRGRVSIEIKGVGQGANTLSLLEYAQKLVAQSHEEYKHVWLVYDKDDFPKDDFDNTYFKCEALSNDAVTYHALWSNECIEYWFLLHYNPLNAALHRNQYYPMLTNHIGSPYTKNRKDIYDILKPNLKTAISTAKSIYSQYGGLPPSKCMPGTTVYQIFEKLESYLK